MWTLKATKPEYEYNAYNPNMDDEIARVVTKHVGATLFEPCEMEL
jgi:hypothetical protein